MTDFFVRLRFPVRRRDPLAFHEICPVSVLHALEACHACDEPENTYHDEEDHEDHEDDDEPEDERFSTKLRILTAYVNTSPRVARALGVLRTCEEMML